MLLEDTPISKPSGSGLNWLEITPEYNVKGQWERIATWLVEQYHVAGIALILDDDRLDQYQAFTQNFPNSVLLALQKVYPELNRANEEPGGVTLFASEAENLLGVNIRQCTRILEPLVCTIPLATERHSIGILALITEADSSRSLLGQEETSCWFAPLVSLLLDSAISHEQKSRKIRMLNLYQTVSSSLSYIGDLNELLFTILSLITSELPCEEGSVLLHDDCKHEFEFFTVVGESQGDLINLRFPANKGVAGRALRENKSLAVNDVSHCPDFYCAIDKLHNFRTRSILATPLRLGGETVGVIEAINKLENRSFTKGDEQILSAIADEVALAIRDARLLECGVDLYCKRRQGQMNCKECKRPLKSWTPCALHLDFR
jgi:GAF domain-containing protein